MPNATASPAAKARAARAVDEIRVRLGAMKAAADTALRTQNYRDAWDKYTACLEIAEHGGLMHRAILSNRCAAYTGGNRIELALKDADELQRLWPAWPKSWFRGAKSRERGRQHVAALMQYGHAWRLESDATAKADIRHHMMHCVTHITLPQCADMLLTFLKQHPPPHPSQHAHPAHPHNLNLITTPLLLATQPTAPSLQPSPRLALVPFTSSDDVNTANPALVTSTVMATPGTGHHQLALSSCSASDASNQWQVVLREGAVQLVKRIKAEGASHGRPDLLTRLVSWACAEHGPSPEEHALLTALLLQQLNRWEAAAQHAQHAVHHAEVELLRAHVADEPALDRLAHAFHVLGTAQLRLALNELLSPPCKPSEFHPLPCHIAIHGLDTHNAGVLASEDLFQHALLHLALACEICPGDTGYRSSLTNDQVQLLGGMAVRRAVRTARAIVQRMTALIDNTSQSASNEPTPTPTPAKPSVSITAGSTADSVSSPSHSSLITLQHATTVHKLDGSTSTLLYPAPYTPLSVCLRLDLVFDSAVNTLGELLTATTRIMLLKAVKQALLNLPGQCETPSITPTITPTVTCTDVGDVKALSDQPLPFTSTDKAATTDSCHVTSSHDVDSTTHVGDMNALNACTTTTTITTDSIVTINGTVPTTVISRGNHDHHCSDTREVVVQLTRVQRSLTGLQLTLDAQMCDITPPMMTSSYPSPSTEMTVSQHRTTMQPPTHDVNINMTPIDILEAVVAHLCMSDEVQLNLGHLGLVNRIQSSCTFLPFSPSPLSPASSAPAPAPAPASSAPAPAVLTDMDESPASLPSEIHLSHLSHLSHINDTQDCSPGTSDQQLHVRPHITSSSGGTTPDHDMQPYTTSAPSTSDNKVLSVTPTSIPPLSIPYEGYVLVDVWGNLVERPNKHPFALSRVYYDAAELPSEDNQVWFQPADGLCRWRQTASEVQVIITQVPIGMSAKELQVDIRNHSLEVLHRPSGHTFLSGTLERGVLVADSTWWCTDMGGCGFVISLTKMNLELHARGAHQHSDTWWPRLFKHHTVVEWDDTHKDYTDLPVQVLEAHKQRESHSSLMNSVEACEREEIKILRQREETHRKRRDRAMAMLLA